jgi:exopolysaccharide biosynthesis polyprenyl glycosylphosphotransferase
MDTAAIAVATALSYSMDGAISLAQHLLLGAVALPLWLLLIVATGQNRSFERVQSRARLLAGMLIIHGLGLLGLALFMFTVHGRVDPGPPMILAATTFALMYAQRASLERWLRFQHQRGISRAHLLLVGAPSRTMAAFVRAARRDSLPPRLVGYLAPASLPPDAGSSIIDDLPEPLGSEGDLERVLHERVVDHVIFFPPLNRPDTAAAARAHCETAGVQASLLMDAGAEPRSRTGLLHGHRFATYEVAPRSPVAAALKQALDVTGACMALILLSPLLLATALAILVSMGRPILFTQQRSGLHGRAFRMVKFRTMVRDAESRRGDLAQANEMSGPVFKVTNDPRTTRLGRLLRKTSIDELPQLFNVLLGDMSLVGPRPLPVAEQQAIRGPAHRRLSVKPGITGLWQVSGRNDTDFDQWMALDLRYIDEWSLLRDVRILLLTVPVVILGKGAR